MAARLCFRHCDWRLPFLWQSDRLPAARWHGDGDGPANYFADTPIGAWAEFLRHEEITGPADLAGIQRSLWLVELPDDGYAAPRLSATVKTGGLSSYPTCQAEARRLRRKGAQRLEAPAAALLSTTKEGPKPGAAVAAEAARAACLRTTCSPEVSPVHCKQYTSLHTR